MTDAPPLARRHVFVSYWSGEAEEVRRLIEAIEARGVTVWYDRELEPGKYRPQIMQAITRSAMFVAILSEGGVGPASSGWVADELRRAREDDVPMLLPCIVGDFAMPEAIDRALGAGGTGPDRDAHALQRIAVGRVADLRSDPRFLAYIDLARDRIDGRPTQRISDYIAAARSGPAAPDRPTVETWYAAAPAPAEQALALSVATLVDVPADIVVAVADGLATTMDQRLRPLTEAELEKQPRAIGAVSRSDRLTRIHARRATVQLRMESRQVEVLRFDDPNWRTDLLLHVWTERDDVREIFVAWVTACLDDPRTAHIGHAIGRSLGILAQARLDSLMHTVVRPWLASGPSRRRISVLDDILSSAVERRDAVPTVRILLEELAAHRPHAALRLALGAVGLRRPEIAVAVLRKVGRRAFADDALRGIVEGSAALGGARRAVEEETGGDAPDFARNAAEGPAEPEEVGAYVAVGTPEDAPGDAAEDAPAEEPTGAVAAARVMAALGAWADARIEPRDPEAKLARQSALIALLMCLSRLGPTDEDRGHLDLAVLTGAVRRWDPTILEDILRGLVRVAAARPVPGWPYRAPTHLRRVLLSLARQARETGETRPLETFAGWLHAAVEEHHPDRASFVTDALSGVLPDTAVALVATAPPFDPNEDASDEPAA